MYKTMKSLLIGLFVLVGIFLIIGIILFIKPSIGDGKQELKVRFNNINGIQVGTRVTLAGKPIGDVEKINQIPNARQTAVNSFGLVFPFVLTLKIDSQVKVYSTDQFTVQTQGLLGEKYIAIIPKAQLPGRNSVVLNSKDIIYADSTDLFESAVNEFSALSDKMENTLEKIMQWMDKYGDNLGCTITSIGSLASGLSKTVSDINKKISTSKLNYWLKKTIQEYPHPRIKGREVKFKYATQVSANPLTIKIFSNFNKEIKTHYQRYLHNNFTDYFNIKNKIIKIVFSKNQNPYN